MRTLAQTLLDGHVDEAHPAHPISPHVEQILRTGLNGLPTDIFVFDKHPSVSIAPHVLDGHLAADTVMSTRSPISLGWFEWPSCEEDGHTLHEACLYGEGSVLSEFKLFRDAVASVKRGGVTNVVITTVFLDRRIARVIGAAVTSPEGTSVAIHDDIGETSEFVECIQNARLALNSAFFLLTTPRAVELVPHHWDSKLQKSRAKHGKPPLVEYKHVKIEVGPGATQRRHEDGIHGSGITGKRLHSVIGHFRELHESTPAEPRLSWVRPHWRGDAKLGIVSKQREVRYVPDQMGDEHG